MRSREIFGVAVRVIGLLAVLGSVVYFVGGVVVLIAPELKPNVSPWLYVLNATVFLTVGLYLLRGAQVVIRFSYPGAELGNNVASHADDA
jgi:hypothetical protein